MPTRRDFLIGAATAGLPGIVTSGVAGPAPAATAANLREDAWDQGRLVHLLPTVSHDRFLIKASFDRPLAAAPELGIGTNRVRGEQNPAGGSFWQFDAPGLEPATTYRLSLTEDDGRSLCEPWPLSTFPAPDAMPSRLRLMIYTCGGGHDALNAGLPDGKINWLPSALRRRLLVRGLSFKPNALIANGDQVYWDLRAPQASKGSGASAKGIAFAGTFDRAQPVFGTANETAFLRATGPQIVPQYGALCRSQRLGAFAPPAARTGARSFAGFSCSSSRRSRARGPRPPRRAPARCRDRAAECRDRFESPARDAAGA
jgi:hypothetical protein